MHFYLPNFEDLVDPDFNFLTEKPSPQRLDRYSHDWYAHQFFDESIFDGMLVSKTVISNSVEERIREAGGIHAFCRLEPTIPIMGDCGAFTYVNEPRPPYRIEDILDYYQSLGFTFGVSIDHLVFSKMDQAERERRQNITLDNARAFLQHHRSGNYTFTPVGIAQGWDPLSRYEAVAQLLDMGYTHLALGGMARSTDHEIRATLQAIHPLLSAEIQCHLFGVARLALVADFVQYGITSADSASPIRRAFLGTGEDNYWTLDGTKFAAIRVPEAKKGTAKKRGVRSTEEIMSLENVTLGEMQSLEKQALSLLRGYHEGAAELEETLEAVLVYDRLYGDNRNHEDAYRRTLSERPWQSCPCAICRQYGVEVIIFRGNNRNRRRGFHNSWVFYRQLQNAVHKAQQTGRPKKDYFSELHLSLSKSD